MEEKWEKVCLIHREGYQNESMNSIRLLVMIMEIKQ